MEGALGNVKIHTNLTYLAVDYKKDTIRTLCHAMGRELGDQTGHNQVKKPPGLFSTISHINATRGQLDMLHLIFPFESIFYQ